MEMASLAVSHKERSKDPQLQTRLMGNCMLVGSRHALRRYNQILVEMYFMTEEWTSTKPGNLGTLSS